MGFAKEDTLKLQETDLTMFTRTCIGAKLTFIGTGLNNMTELQTRWWLDFVDTLKTRSDTNDFDEMCIWLGTTLPHKTLKTTWRSILEELGRCLDDRLTLSDKELHPVAYGSDNETEDHYLEKSGKDYGGKWALFNLKDTAIL